MRDHSLDGSLRGFHSTDGLTGIKRSFQSDADARQQLSNILLSVGLNWISDRIILRASADTPYAEAGINIKTHERFIFYNARFIQRLSQQTGDYWSLLYIFAHELGHHLAFHVETAGRNHEFELEADYFAGFVLRKMGASLEQTEAAIVALAPEESTPTHPGRAERVQMLTIGWTDGGSQGSPQAPKLSELPEAPKEQPIRTAPPEEKVAVGIIPNQIPSPPETNKAGCDTLEHIEVCVSNSGWAKANLAGEFIGSYTSKNKYYLGIIYEPIGSNDGYTYEFLKSAIIQNAAAPSGVAPEKVPVLESNDEWSEIQGFRSITYAPIINGASFVFHNVYKIYPDRAVQFAFWTIGREFKDEFRNEIRNFLRDVNFTLPSAPDIASESTNCESLEHIQLCLDASGWNKASLPGDFLGSYTTGGKYFVGIVYEPSGSNDGYTYEFLKQAIIQNAANAAGTDAAKIPVLDSSENAQEVNGFRSVTYNPTINGAPFVFHNVYKIYPDRAVQFAFWSIGREYTDEFRQNVEKFTASLRFAE
jgi:hypothetical protein